MLSTSPLIPTLPAADLSRATKFYTECLGLEHLPAAIGALFRTGKGTNLWLYQQALGEVVLASSHFIVRDIRPVITKLRDQGVTFEEYDLPGLKTTNGVGKVGPLKFAWFRDTEGNMLNLME